MLDPRFNHLTPAEKASALMVSLDACAKAEAARSQEIRLNLPDDVLAQREAARLNSLAKSINIDPRKAVRPGDTADPRALLHAVSLEVAEDPEAIAEVARLAENSPLRQRAQQQLRGYAQVARLLPLGTEETDAHRAALNTAQWLTGRSKSLTAVVAGSPADTSQRAVLKWAASDPEGFGRLADWQIDLRVERISVASAHGNPDRASALSQAARPQERMTLEDVAHLTRARMPQCGHTLTSSNLRASDNGDLIRHCALKRLEGEQRARTELGATPLQFRARPADTETAETRARILATQGGPRGPRTTPAPQGPDADAAAAALAVYSYLTGRTGSRPDLTRTVEKNGVTTMQFRSKSAELAAASVIEQARRDPAAFAAMKNPEKRLAVLAQNIARNPRIGDSLQPLSIRTAARPDLLDALRDTVALAAMQRDAPHPPVRPFEASPALTPGEDHAAFVKYAVETLGLTDNSATKPPGGNHRSAGAPPTARAPVKSTYSGSGTGTDPRTIPSALEPTGWRKRLLDIRAAITQRPSSLATAEPPRGHLQRSVSQRAPMAVDVPQRT